MFKDYQPGVVENGGKIVVLMDIIEESLKLGEKLLIFRLYCFGSNLIIESFRLETFRLQDEEDYEYDI